jgi:Mrp family chromosome partitioning ATPase
LEPDQVSNLSITEQPTPPSQDEKKLKLVAEIAGGGVALGLGLAFLLELLLDRSLRRPKEVASRLGLPFFLSVPYLNGHGPLRLSKRGKAVKLLAAGTAAPGAGSPEVRAPGPAHEGPVAPWDENHALRPFHEALRDRLIAYFEAHDMTHKPKLVALTGCHRGAGVSTMASGLACLLSETGEGNVLLVNMNSEEGDAHRFYKGKLNLGLDDIFEKEKEMRAHALVQENLYVVKESSRREKLPGILPKRFSHLVSKMKASDYDYIIFDMPPVTPTSITPRLARFMDMVLLVVESEKTDREVAQQAAALLSESRTNLAVVMNKSRSYVPRRLLQEFGGKPG